MSTELQISPPLVAEIRAELERGRSRLEESAGSAPGSVDAGEMTAMLLGMLGKLTDASATASEAIGALAQQVGEAGTAFWQTDTGVAQGFGGGTGR